MNPIALIVLLSLVYLLVWAALSVISFRVCDNRVDAECGVAIAMLWPALAVPGLLIFAFIRLGKWSKNRADHKKGQDTRPLTEQYFTPTDRDS